MSEDLTKKLPKTDSEKLNQILTTTQNLEGRFDKLESRFDKLEGRFENLETRVYGVDTRLGQIEETVDKRLHDTRPIWQKVVADIAQLQAGQERLEQGQSVIREQLVDMSSRVRDVNRDQIVINESLRRIQMDLRTIDERLYKIELNRSQRNSST